MNVQSAKEIKISQSKNMLDCGSHQATQTGGLTWTIDDDGIFTITGVPTANYRKIVNQFDIDGILVDGATYTLSKTAGGRYIMPQIVLKNKQTSAESYINVTEPDYSSFVVDKSTYTYKAAVQSTSMSVWGEDSRTITAGFQLEAGTGATTYEPYVAPQDVKIIHDKDSRLLWGRLEYDTKYEGNAWQQTYTGKNLFDTQKVNNLALASGGYIVTGTDYRSYYMKVSAGDTLTVSRYTTTGNNRFRIAFTAVVPDVGGVVYNQYGVANSYDSLDNATEGTFTVPNGMEYIFVYLSNNGANITPSLGIQLESGSTATDYEPYVGGTPAPNPSYPQDIKVVQGPQKITVRGRNLFSFDAYGTFAYGQSGSITQTHTDTSAHMVAIGTSGAQYVRTTIDGFDPRKSYTVSCKAKKIVSGTDGQPRLRVFIQYSDDGISFLSYNSDNIIDPVVGQVYTLSKGFTGHPCYRFYFYNNSSTTVSIGEETEYWDIQVRETPKKDISFTPNSTVTNHSVVFSTYNDGKVIANGTSDAVAQVRFTGYTTFTKGRTYMLMVNNPVAPPSGAGANIKFLMADSSQPYVCSFTAANATYTFTATDTADFALALRFNSGVTLNNFETRPEVFDITDEPFEAYGPSKTVNLDLRGTNLFNKDVAPTTYHSTYSVVDNTITVSANNEASNSFARFPIEYDLNTPLTITYDAKVIANETNISWGLVYLRKGSTHSASSQFDLSKIGEVQHLSVYDAVGATLEDMELWLYPKVDNPSGAVVVEFSNIQVEYGDQSTTYQPYHAPYELKRVGNYADYFYKDGSDWKLKTQVGKVMFSGGSSEYWTKLNLAFQTVVTDNKGSQINSAYSDYYSYYPAQSAITSNIGNGQFGWNTTNNLTIRNDSCADATAFKTWLQSHNTSVYYNLATPTDTVITDAVLIEKLNSIHDWLNRYGYHADVVGDLPIVINQESL